MNAVLLNQMAQLFIMIGIGYVLYKFKYLTVEINQKLTKLLLDITLPILIIASVMNQDTKVDSSKIAIVFLVSFCVYAGLSILSVIVIKILHFPKKQQGLYMFMHTFANTAFMGFPVIKALYGDQALLYTGILNIFFNLFVYTVGIIQITYDPEHAGSLKESIRMMEPRKLFSIGTIGSLAALVIYFLPVRFPELVHSVCSTVGGLTSPLAMMIIGATLARMPLNRIFNSPRVYLFTAVRQFVFPLLLWPLMKLVIPDTLILNVVYILTIMPVANTSVLFASRYGKDEELAAKTVFVTTLFSLISIPVCMIFMG